MFVGSLICPFEFEQFAAVAHTLGSVTSAWQHAVMFTGLLICPGVFLQSVGISKMLENTVCNSLTYSILTF